jgi:hypothetical protein
MANQKPTTFSLDAMISILGKSGPISLIAGFLLFNVFQVLIPKHEETMRQQIEVCHQIISTFKEEIRKIEEHLDKIEKNTLINSK